MSVAWLFPGQGSHSVGMLDAWTAASSIVGETLAEADEVLGFPISDLIAGGPQEQLHDTYNQQPALVVAGVAIARAAQADGRLEAADYVAGHSVGEFAALIAAGALSFADGLSLVRERARLMADAGRTQPGGMAAILGLERSHVEEVVRGFDSVQVANDNAPGQIVISGTQDGVTAASAALTEAGARRVIPVRITVAAHSALMAPAAAQFEQAIESVVVHTPRIPVLSNVEAQPLRDVEAVLDEMRRQLTHGVQWTASMRRLLHEGVETFVEVGPGSVLSGLIKRTARADGATIRIRSLATPERDAG